MWQLHTDPSPRNAVQTYSPVQWRVNDRRALPITDGHELIAITDALEQRQSTRAFEPVSTASLASLLWHVARTKNSAMSSAGVLIEHRMAPSAGAIHPIHVIVQLPGENDWARYNPQAHSLDVLADAAHVLKPLVAHCDEVVSHQAGSIILFVAEPGKTSAKYERSESLVWRDAGILQGSFGLVAASLKLNYCLLGITGNPWVASLSDEGELQGVGMAILGARP